MTKNAIEVLRSLMVIALISFIWNVPSVQAQYSTLSFQGLLTDAGGDPVADGNYDLQFRIYPQPTGGPVLWAESQNLPVANGIVSATLGSVTPINLSFDEQYYVGVVIDGDTLQPRTKLTASPYSFIAKTLDVPVTLASPSSPLTTLTVNPGASGNAATFNGNVLIFADSSRVSGPLKLLDRVRVQDQFSVDGQLNIPASGNISIGNVTAQEKLHILDSGGSTGVKLGGGGTQGPHGIVFDDDVADAGVSLLWRTGDNRLILERTSAGTDVDGGDAFYYDRDDERFLFQGTRNTSASFSGHLVGINNLGTGSSDGLGIQLGNADPDNGNNFISFFDGAGAAYGRIEGNGTNGVVYVTTGGDYAEYLPRLNPSEVMAPGDVVGVVENGVTHDTDTATRVMVITDRPAVLGNAPDSDKEHLYEPVAFVGQVPVRVTGRVEWGDFLLASGMNDGTAIARSPQALKRDEVYRVVGVAWQSSPIDDVKPIVAAVGLDRARAVNMALQNEIMDLRRAIADQEERIDALMAHVQAMPN